MGALSLGLSLAEAKHFRKRIPSYRELRSGLSGEGTALAHLLVEKFGEIP